MILCLKSELEGFIKCIQAAEKEIKVKGSQSILLIEKVRLIYFNFYLTIYHPLIK